MGLRGPGAKPIGKRRDDSDVVDLFNRHAPRRPPTPPAWLADGLSRADRVIAFIESLEVTAGRLAGQPLRLRPWQKTIIEELYATDETGARPVRTGIISMGRKNGKTGLSAALALCHLSGPEAEQRGECYSAANDREQAGKLFAEMVAMIERHDWLSQRINVKRFTKELHDVESDSIFRALSADVAGKHGLSPSFVVYDELGQAPNRALFDTLDTAMGARDNPLMIVISTQAATDTAPMSDLIDYGQKVTAGIEDDPTFKLFFFAAPAEANPWDEETWKLANPALGDFLSLEEVQRQARQAQRMPAKEPAFRNLILNQRVAAESHFMTAVEWQAAAGEVDIARLEGRTCFAGLDLSATRDLTALVLVFPDDDGSFDVVPYFWLPNDNLHEREADDRVPYWAWRKAGVLETTPGPTVDRAFIAARVAEVATKYRLRLLAFDRWRIKEFQNEMEKTGVAVEMEPFGQGFKDMAPAVDAIERLVIERKLRHGGNPILTMCALNSVATGDPAGNRKLDKERSRGRIDGIVALAMALGAAIKTGVEKPQEFFFEQL